ncbi:MAG: thiosulfate oxidation carrier protein SoxY [Rhodobacteraceae bacterium]|nr:MAG: thiosulfate oxidation carrier protein SoxY [Paracoccaceae bacterium]
MKIDRRGLLAVGGSLACTTLVPFKAIASETDEAIAKFTGGANIGTGGITLTTPEIAENGNTVPISVESGKASSIILLALGNPNPNVATINFGPLSGSRMTSTRIRLRKTQEVVAIAKLEDGSFTKDVKTVKVTIGGCGG